MKFVFFCFALRFFANYLKFVELFINERLNKTRNRRSRLQGYWFVDSVVAYLGFDLCIVGIERRDGFDAVFVVVVVVAAAASAATTSTLADTRQAK